MNYQPLVFILAGQDRINLAHVVSMRPMTDQELAGRRFRIGTKITTVNDEVFWADERLDSIFYRIREAYGVRAHY